MKLRKFCSGFILLACLMLSTIPALAATSQDYQVNSVEVNGIDDVNSAVYVERGGNIEIDVFLQGIGATTDVKVSAWIDGYEYGELRDSTGLFEVENNVTYHKELSIDVPDDIEAGETYELHIRIADKNNEFEDSREVRLQEKRHALDIMKVYFRDSSTVESGRPLFITVRVENVGDKDEDDIEINVAIPALGVEATSFIDELEKDDSTSEELFIRIPNGVKPGAYDLVVSILYNNGHDFVKQTNKVFISGAEEETEETKEEGNIVVNVDSTSKNVEQGKAVIYKIGLANLGTKTGSISASVKGASDWASSTRIDPSSITVQPDSTGEMFVYVSVMDDTQAGIHTFQVELMSGGSKVGEISLVANVSEKVAAGGAWDDVRKALVIGFVVLAIILIILGLVVAFRKVSENGERPEEPASATTSQTYY